MLGLNYIIQQLNKTFKGLSYTSKEIYKTDNVIKFNNEIKEITKKHKQMQKRLLYPQLRGTKHW